MLINKKYLKSILIFVPVLVSFSLTLIIQQGDILAGDKGAGWLSGDSAEVVGFDGYTKVISTLLIVVALIIGTVYVLKKKYGVQANIGRNKKLIQIIDHAPMGVKKSVFLVKVPGKHLLLGVTSDKIGLISEVANEDMDDGNDSGVNKKEFLNLIKKSISERKQQ
ncbi:MAG: flagellar biosynthetic protein FliO [Candidatus Brocadiaceae bacterium]|nr:flagellar biosynthetic protein FliO [Candidatus Brocadiaceae bacterium]